ncbi:MAG: WYL domain-containing protein [Actinobacteria bacterium]|nr:WYL domain-containing protein [Actinomycetota bacterium]
MLETSARLLRLLSLLQEHREWSGPALAARLDVTTRTVRRDVDRLRSLGYPVDATAQSGYRLGRGAALPPLLLDDDEAVAVAAALSTAPGEEMASAAARALAKLEPVLPARLRDRLTAVQAASVTLPSGDAAVPPDRIAALAAACRDAVRVRMTYTDGGGATGERDVEPYRLVHVGRRWYLLGFDRARADWRTLRVDRMADLHVTTFRFTRHDPPDAAAFVGQAVTSSPYRWQARVRVHAPVADVAARVPVTVARLEADGDRCLLTTGAHDLGQLVGHLAALPWDLDVLDPPELRDAVRAAAQRLARAAAGS